MRKKLLALLLAAALALGLLAGCGGKNQSLAQIILNLLDDQYTNVTVEIDPDLEAALRKAVSQAETEEEIRAALEEILGPGISFRLLGDGQKGDTAWNLILYPGNDPDAAGRSAFAEWNKVFAFLPKDGQYGTKIAMIETENGYAILVQATVDRAGSRDDDDKPEDEKVEGTGFTYNVTKKTITVEANNEAGLENLLTQQADEAEEITAARNSGFAGITIELVGTSYSVSQTFGSQSEPFLGTLKSAAGSRATITLQAGSNGLFVQIGMDGGGSTDNGKVENINFYVQAAITATNDAGAIVGFNNGTITSCTVTNCKITDARHAGGIAGENYGAITSCTVTDSNITDARHAGGLVGYNKGTIDGICKVKNTSISADEYAGGLVGYNGGSGEVNGTYTGTGTITAENTSGFAYAGGLVGRNDGGTVTGTYEGTAFITATGTNYTYAGGLVGDNVGTVGGTYSGSGSISAKSTSWACAGGLVGRNAADADKVTAQNTGTPSISAKVGEKSARLDAGDSNNGIGGSGNDSTPGTAYAGTRIGYQYT